MGFPKSLEYIGEITRCIKKHISVNSQLPGPHRIHKTLSMFEVFCYVSIISRLCLCFQTRSRFEGTRSEVYELLKRIKESPQEYRQTSPISSEGYLYMQEKRTKNNFYDVTLGCLLPFTDCHVMYPVPCWLHY